MNNTTYEMYVKSLNLSHLANLYACNKVFSAAHCGYLVRQCFIRQCASWVYGPMDWDFSHCGDLL